MLLSGFQERLRWKELRSLRLLNVIVAVIITILGFVFEFAYHDGYILVTGLLLSLLFIANYYLSVYSPRIQKHFTNITYLSILLLHVWAVFVAFLRDFEIGFLLPVALSTFIFSLIFDRFYKSFLFIFFITTLILLLMLYSGEWRTEYTIALAALYSGAILADIILKRRNEYQQEIQRREDQYITLVENMNDGLIYLDLQLKITYVNDRFCEITGLSREEVTGKHVMNVYPAGDHAKAVLRFFQGLSAGKSVRMEGQMRRQDGTLVSVQMAGAPLKVASGFRVVYADITTLKETQDRLKRREEAYRTFIDQSDVGIWRGEFPEPVSMALPAAEQARRIMDTGTIAECNDFMAQVYGHSHAREMTGRGIQGLFSFSDDYDPVKAEALFRKFVENDYRLSNVETRLKGRQGTRYYLTNIIGIVEGGQLVRTWGIQADITDRKNTERELVQTNQELDTFFYKASHDLKGPLASIMGIVQLARLEKTDAEWPNYLDMIESSTRRLDNTLLDLIELARTRKGVSKINPLRLGILVDEVLYSLKHMNGYNEVTFTNNVSKEFEIFSDSLLLQSILQNLVHNAINYRSPESASIEIKAVHERNETVIIVIDNGKGIPEDIRNKVFDMFYRGHPDSAGSGLGLFIVKNAVDKLNGSISFESAVGKGTTFTVRLPDIAVE